MEMPDMLCREGLEFDVVPSSPYFPYLFLPVAKSNAKPYANLGPDRILDAIESLGLVTDGRLLALNSYENRVYQVGIEAGSPLIAKFYRPGRWTDAAIQEEHAFTLELAEREIPAVPPLAIGGKTLHAHAGYRFSLCPRRGGRPPELGDPKVLAWIGRFLGRIHALGAAAPFRHRPTLDIASFGDEPRAFLLAQGWLPAELRAVYEGVSAHALDEARRLFEQAGPVRYLRLHGDCHAGNLLWTDDGPHFVDFDDSRRGPAVQDLWMLLSGDRQEMSGQLGYLLSGYEDFRDFDPRELHLVEALRTLRLIHYSAWIARRWQDPAFPLAFPWFNTQRYWQDRILELREQIAAMQEGPL
jgi:Ser/Thr protein kinase RdoA (MazF antagonist)